MDFLKKVKSKLEPELKSTLRAVESKVQSAESKVKSAASELRSAIDEATHKPDEAISLAKSGLARANAISEEQVTSKAQLAWEELKDVFGVNGVVHPMNVLEDVVSHKLEELRLVTDILRCLHDNAGVGSRLRRGMQHPNFAVFLLWLIGVQKKLPSDFYPRWMIDMGGCFVKLAQMLSYRDDLIPDQDILREFAKAREELEERAASQVEKVLRQEIGTKVQHIDVQSCLGRASIGQVNKVVLGTETYAVKVAWPDHKDSMKVDFCLISAAYRVLQLWTEKDGHAPANVKTVLLLLEALQESEPAVMQEFNLQEEATSMQVASGLLPEWRANHDMWLADEDVQSIFGHCIGSFLPQACKVNFDIPSVKPAFVTANVLTMSVATGVPLRKLLEDEDQQGVAFGLALGCIVPLFGWLLCCHATKIVHTDPHHGNFRWDQGTETLYVLDWGGTVVFPRGMQEAFQSLVYAVSQELSDAAVAACAREFGIQHSNDTFLAHLMTRLLAGVSYHSGEEALKEVSSKNFQSVEKHAAPVVRCLALLSGIVAEAYSRLPQKVQAAPLAVLWLPFIQWEHEVRKAFDRAVCNMTGKDTLEEKRPGAFHDFVKAVGAVDAVSDPCEGHSLKIGFIGGRHVGKSSTIKSLGWETRSASGDSMLACEAECFVPSDMYDYSTIRRLKTMSKVVVMYVGCIAGVAKLYQLVEALDVPTLLVRNSTDMLDSDAPIDNEELGVLRREGTLLTWQPPRRLHISVSAAASRGIGELEQALKTPAKAGVAQ